MPHKCTRCESIFEDGAPVILSGCPNCGWNKFLYVKEEELEVTDKEESGSEAGGAEETGHAIIDESSAHKPEGAAVGKIIREIDEIIGPQNKEKLPSEDEGERVESVRILGPGCYELNLESLLDRKEIIMAIKEDGTYALHLPSVFKRDKDKEKDWK